MIKTSKPYEVIYMTSIAIATKEDGNVRVFLAVDDYSENLFPPAFLKNNAPLNEMVDQMITFWNTIHENYNPTIHSKQTTFFVDFPLEILQLLKSITPRDSSILLEPTLVENAFNPVLEHMKEFFDNL